MSAFFMDVRIFGWSVLRKLNECDDAVVLVRRDNHKFVRTCAIIYCTPKLCLARFFAEVFNFNRLNGQVSRVSSYDIAICRIASCHKQEEEESFFSCF